MRRLRSLVLLSAGSLGLLLCAVAAHADSIPTLTATSVCYSTHSGFKSWTISGDSFSVSGGGGALGTPGGEIEGQPFDRGSIDAFFGTSYGPSGPTYGTVTLDGVTHDVLLENLPSFIYPPGLIYQRTVTRTNPDGSLAIATPVPTVIGYPSGHPNLGGFQELFCTPPEPPALIPAGCLGNALANVSIDVPGITTLYGFKRPVDDFDAIGAVVFTTTPEPVSYGLAVIGMTAMVAFGAYRRRRAQ